MRNRVIFLGLAIIGSFGAAAKPSQQPSQTPKIVAEKLDPAANLEGQLSSTKDIAETKSTTGEAEASEFTVILKHRFKISDLLLVIFTAGLFLATIVLAWSTRNLVVGAADSSKRQLMAYISAHPINFKKIGPNENLWFYFNMVNHGHTPAYSCTHSGDIFFLDYPLQENFRFPKLPSERPSKFTVYSNVPSQGHVLSTKKLTQAQWIEAFQAPASGGKRLYFFGQIDYVDAFRAKHWTRFCFSFTGHHEMMPLANQGNWAEINRIYSQPFLAIAFE